MRKMFYQFNFVSEGGVENKQKEILSIFLNIFHRIAWKIRREASTLLLELPHFMIYIYGAG